MAPPQAPSPSSPIQPHLAEVWGDTVDLRHLAWSIAIGIGISVLAFYVASHWLTGIVESPQLAHAYAMLAGLAGCVIAGVICGRAFAPKREVSEDHMSEDPQWRQEVLEELAQQPGGLGELADLPPSAVAELKELHLYALFEQATTTGAVTNSATGATTGTARREQGSI